MSMHARDIGGERLNPVALITGAGSGMGAAAAQRLAEKATGGLVLIDGDEDALSAVADGLENPPERVSTLAFNVADPERWRRASDFILDHYGRLDWAVINACTAHRSLAVDATDEDWRRGLSVDLDGAFVTMKAATALMRANSSGGAIVVTGLAPGLGAEPGIAAYGASQAGLLQLMRVTARDGEADGIRVNSIAPAPSDIPAWRNVPLFQDLVRDRGSERAAFESLASIATPMARYAASDDLARLVEMLLLEATPLTGATLVVDSGYTL